MRQKRFEENQKSRGVSFEECHYIAFEKSESFGENVKLGLGESYKGVIF